MTTEPSRTDLAGHTVSANRRAHTRTRLSVAVRMRVGRRTELCQAGNISSSGMFVAMVYDGPLPEPAKCWLEFTLPGSSVTITARAEIVWQKRYRHYLLLAVQFATLAPSHRRLIARVPPSPGLAARSYEPGGG